MDSPTKIKQDKIHRKAGDKLSLTQHIRVRNEFRKRRAGLHISPGERGEPVLGISDKDRTFGIKPRETPRQTD